MNKLLQTLLKGSGYLLKSYGRITKKQDYYFLGHYLQSSGKFLNLKAKEWGCEFSEDFYDPFRESEIKGFNLEVFKDLEVIGVVFPQFFTKKQNIGNAWGKALLLKKENKFYLGDEYIFYTWCLNKTHFSRCGCEDSEYLRMEQNIYFFRNFGYEKDSYPIFEIRTKNLSIEGGKWFLYIDIHFPDYLFTNKGKPFFVLMEI